MSKPRKRYKLPILKLRFKRPVVESEQLDYPGVAYKIFSDSDKTEIAIHLFSPCNKIITKSWLLNKDLISCSVAGGKEEEINSIDSLLKAVYKAEEEVENMRGKLQYLVVDEKDLKKLSNLICEQSTTLGQKARKGHIEFICDELQQ